MEVKDDSDKLHEVLQEQAQPELARLGLSWDEDVEDVQLVATRAVGLFLKEIPNPHFRILKFATNDPGRLRNAFAASLQEFSTFRSIAAETEPGKRFLLTIRHSERYLQAAIGSNVHVRDEDEFKKFRIPGQHRKGELPYGLLVKGSIVQQDDSETCALAIMLHHAVFDAVVFKNWQEYIAAYLAGQEPAKVVPYTLFTDMLLRNKGSSNAQQGIEFHRARLQGMSSFKHSLWPRAALKDQGQKDKMVKPDNAQKASTPAVAEVVEVNSHVKIVIVERVLPRLRLCPVRPSIIAKAAIAMTNCLITNSENVILMQLLAGRTWPCPDSEANETLPDIMRVAGPTLTNGIDVIKFKKEEIITKMLQRLDKEQRSLTQYQHASIGEIVPVLSPEDRGTLPFATAQVFNWFPPMKPGDSLETQGQLVVREEYKLDEPSNAVFWKCQVQYPENKFKLELRRDKTLCTEEESSALVETVFSLMEALTDEENWKRKFNDVLAQERSKKHKLPQLPNSVQEHTGWTWLNWWQWNLNPFNFWRSLRYELPFRLSLARHSFWYLLPDFGIDDRLTQIGSMT